MRFFRFILVYAFFSIIAFFTFVFTNLKKLNYYYSKISNYFNIDIEGDKFFHFLFFIFYPILIFLSIKILVKIKDIYNMFCCFMFSSFFIFLIEIMQPFFGRHYSILDIKYGLFGLFISFVFLSCSSIFLRYLNSQRL